MSKVAAQVLSTSYNQNLEMDGIVVNICLHIPHFDEGGFANMQKVLNDIHNGNKIIILESSSSQIKTKEEPAKSTSPIDPPPNWGDW